MTDQNIKNTFFMTGISFIAIFTLASMLSFTSIGMPFVYISGIWLLMAASMYKAIKKFEGTMIYIGLNILMTGVLVGSYYNTTEATVKHLFMMFITSIIVLLIEYFLMNRFVDKRKLAKFIISIIAINGIVWLFRWIGGDDILASGIVMVSILVICLNVSIYVFAQTSRVYDEIAVMKLSSMLVFGGILIAVVSVLTEGDLFDFPIMASTDGSKKKPGI